jgi:hypothetical protein
MTNSVSLAKGQLTELVKLAEAGGRANPHLLRPRRCLPGASQGNPLGGGSQGGHGACVRVLPCACKAKPVRCTQTGIPIRREDWTAEVIVVDTSALMAIVLDEPKGWSMYDRDRAESRLGSLGGNTG